MPRHDLLLIFPALMRSGHHAIIQWIQSHFDQPQYELNDAIPFESPFRTDWYEPHAPPDKSTRLATVNFEDVDLRRCKGGQMLNSQLLGKVDRTRYVLVLRDPYNLLASKLRLIRTRDWWHQDRQRAQQTSADIIALWKVMAREFLNETNYLGSARPTIRVSFNNWFLSRDYRDDIAMKVGFHNQDLAVNTVSDRGQGSSFDHQDFDGRAQEMSVLDRWQAFRDDPEFQLVLGDRELHELAAATTGLPPAWPGAK